MPASTPDFRLLLFSSAEWNGCVSAYLKHLYSKSGSLDTLDLYRRILRQFFTLPTKLPPTYTRTDVLTYLLRPCQSTRNQGGAPSISTRNARLTTLSSFYRFASTYSVTRSGTSVLLLECPVPTIGIAYGKVPRNPRGMTEQELERFFAVIPTATVQGLRDRALFLMYFWTGRRRSEIARLCYGDITATTIVEENGTRRAGWQYVYRGKGRGQQYKAMELPRLAKFALDRYLEVSGRLATIRPDDPLFVSMRLGAKEPTPLHRNSIVRLFKIYGAKAGLDMTRFSLHSLRHTSAQQRFFAGQDLLSLQRWLGHSSIETTRGYLELLTGQADTGAPLLEAKFATLSG